MAWIPLAIAAVQAVGEASKAQPAFGAPVASDPFGAFDHSSWTVATGSATATASRTQTTGAELSDVQRLVPWLVVGLVGVVVAKAWRARKP